MTVAVLPLALAPVDTIMIGSGDHRFEASRSRPRFVRPTTEVVMIDPFGSKPLVDWHGEAVFAELAICAALMEAGWDARWVCTYGRPSMAPLFSTRWDPSRRRIAQTATPIGDQQVEDTLHEIARLNGKFGGCWDVLAWRDGELRFFESKLSKRDRIRDTQVRWLACSLQVGLTVDDFQVVEWAYQ